MPPRFDVTAQRLFIDQPMASGAELVLDKDQTNYLVNVLRMREGGGLLVFNGHDGEWRAAITLASKKAASLKLTERLREQPQATDIWLCFAPIKSARLDYMVQKAVEMGASRLIPVATNRTQVEVKNPDRLRSNIIEAAEQCGVLAVPELAGTIRLSKLPTLVEKGRAVIFCDEMADVANPVEALKGLRKGAPVAVLVGPEGGFDPDERQMIMDWPGSVAIALGPRILRADTAAVAALAAIQLAVGDWDCG
jgi:16S rRNA (uracil1498-N3)-methyltransferase